MSRPACVVETSELAAEKRPRFLPADGVGAWVRPVGNATGLTRMGVWMRSIAPGFAGTHRHAHEVEEEWAFVLAGEGVVRIGDERQRVSAGSFAGFPPGPGAHHFIAEGSEALVLLEGGERRPDEESVRYPDLGQIRERGKLVKRDLPSDGEVKSGLCVHLDELPRRDFQHPVDAGARRVMCSLGDAPVPGSVGTNSMWDPETFWVTRRAARPT